MSKPAIQYSRCHIAPTASSLAFQLGYLQEVRNAVADDVEIALKLGDYGHYDDAYWMRHAANAKALWARSRGADTYAVAFSWYENALPVYALPESGLKRPADLAGRRIAAIETKGQSFDYDRMVYLRPFASALATVDLSLKDVREVKSVVEREMIHDAAPTAKNFTQQMAELFLRQLLRGEVDAIATSLPAEVVRFFDLVTVYDGRKDSDINARVDLRALVVSGSVVREHRAALVAIVAALMRTGSWALENAPEVVPLIAKDVNIDDKMLRARGVDFVRGSQIDASEEFVEIMRKRKDFLLATGLLEKDFDIDQWVDRSIVRDAKALLHAKVG